MRKSKRARLKAAGWVVGSVKEFLGLSETEAVLIEMKLALQTRQAVFAFAPSPSDGEVISLREMGILQR
ncbi:MAG TPA: hypothetical protein VLL94_06965 [Nitrospiraceae bacterium]|nr:hypothetical protein [Nitrospiraceae bacterium]